MTMQTHKHSEPLLIGVLPLDICERRHRGNAESIAANLRADKQYGRYGDEIKEMSDTARYKGLGNSFTVNVIKSIVTRMIEKGCLEKELG